MKNLLTVIEAFVFGIFCEIFIRVIIIFYHQTDWNFSGISSMPAVSWILIFSIGIFIATWISGMLTLTLTNFSPRKHLLALFGLYLIWRLSEFYAMDKPSFMYALSIVSLHAIALILAFVIKQKSNV